MPGITKQQAVQMTNNKLQLTIDNQNSQDLQPQIGNPQSAICNSNIAISVRNMSKKYQLYKTPKHRLKEALHPFRKKYHHEFWALRDVSFEVRRGETVGIIGQNGSGKSTLLQIICGTMTPTQGEVETRGRVSALLELGAGFNLEFTGRDNVYLNGVIMGLSRETINARFEDIVSFADIGDFIDQPVKTYSSGMYVRLAFACAINVDPDILIIDEALSVGDAKFQHKCFNKFIEFQEAGKTILFVSHSTDLIVKHCDYAVLLEKGNVVEIDEPKSITNYYLDLLFSGKITGYTHSPVLIEEGYKGFNIVHHKMKYFAISQSLGLINLDIPYEDKFKEHMAEHKLMVGSSLKEAKHLVDQILSPVADSSSQNMESLTVKREKTELDRFLEETPTEDRCIYRNSYNKNEHRYGDKRGEIVDYLIVYKDKYDPVTVYSGHFFDVYIKIKFHKPVNFPVVGFSVKTIDGINLLGHNTNYAKEITIQPIKNDEVVVFKLSLKLPLHSGDYFIDLGIAEGQTDDHIIIDTRRPLIHLNIQQKKRFDGLIDFEPVYDEISRKANALSGG